MRDIALLIAAYVIGSIPFGYILVRVHGGGDIRDRGSGNIGATNVFRAHRKAAGVAVFLLDFAKGFLAVLLARQLSDADWIIAAAALLVVVGHCCSSRLWPCPCSYTTSCGR